MSTPNHERVREAMRYRRKHLANRRTFLLESAARQMRERGKIMGATSRKLHRIEEAVRAYNSLAEESGAPAIR
jgi:hypothetical protein